LAQRHYTNPFPYIRKFVGGRAGPNIRKSHIKDQSYPVAKRKVVYEDPWA